MFYYRLTKKASLELINYFKKCFFAWEKGRIQFTDGQNKIPFCKMPEVMREEKWELRTFPAVLVGSPRGEPFPMSINKDYMDTDETYGKPVYGSYVEMTLPVSTLAETREESNDLADFCLMMILRPDAKEYLLRLGIEIPKPPSLDGDSFIKDQTSEFGLYRTDIGISMNFHWAEIFDPLETVLDIFTDPEFVSAFELI